MSKKKEDFVLELHPRPFYPYIIWIVGLFFVFYKVVLLSYPDILGSQVKKDLGLSDDSYLLLSGIALHMMIIFQFPFGFLVDRYGYRKINPICIAVASLGVLIFSISQSFGMAIFGRLLIGCGVSVGLLSSLKLVSDWFHPKYFALMAGLTFSFGVLGGILGQDLIYSLSIHFGWRLVLLHVSLIGFLYAILYFIIVTDKAYGAKYNINPSIRKFKFSKSIKKFITKPQTWLIIAYIACLRSPNIIFIKIAGVSFFEAKYQLNLAKSVQVHLLFYIGFLFSAPIIAYFSTMQKKRKPYLITASLLSLILLTISIYDEALSLEMHMLLQFMIGLTAGVLPLAYTVLHERNVPRITGTVLGLLGSCFALVAALEFHITRYFSAHFTDTKTFFIFPLSILVALIASFYIQETKAKQRLVEKYNR